MPQTHYFLAVPVANDVKHVLGEWAGMLKDRLPFKTWVHPQDFHITLAFLGHSPFSKLNELKANLEPVLKRKSPIHVEVQNLGTFGSNERPRILWSGVRANPLLSELQKVTYEVCQNSGYDLDRRPFSPHITMARRWEGKEDFDSGLLKEIVHPKEDFLQFTVRDIVLYQTHMNRNPKYQPLKMFSLQGVKE